MKLVIKVSHVRFWMLMLAYVRMLACFVVAEDEFKLFAGSGFGSGWR